MLNHGIETIDHEEKKVKLAFVTSLSLCLRAFIKIGSENNLKSYTYKVSLIMTLIIGFVLFSHYEAILASILIVEKDNIPYNSWSDVVESNKKILLWKGANSEKKFKDAPPGSLLQKIYNEKSEYMNDLGFEGSISKIIDDDYMVFEASTPYEVSSEYPCEIRSVKARSIGCVHNSAFCYT